MFLGRYIYCKYLKMFWKNTNTNTEFVGLGNIAKNKSDYFWQFAD